ncbi:50S ribosomal protein L22 [candidate division WWE3 bacterium]|jgi:large subunit ribosomal protein L22|uniref:Large ribosomal subunit protein uL22 n=1 Tax=candidate division WWE3 bacterium TaxID=2053526 RepID=A0A3A4ZIL6_UNCKA|nr:MAG: 50S ribosomal protein L22 [candidate division WWE3 bacterium]
MEKSQVYAKHMAARITAKKVAPVMDLIRGKNLHDAKVTLAFDRTKASDVILKVLKSAEANAKNNKKLDVKKLYISEVWAGPGPTYKRMRLVAKSRVSPILKRTSHIYIGLSERDNK